MPLLFAVVILFGHLPVSSNFLSRAWRQQTTTPPPPPMTPCWCLTMRAVAPPQAPSAPCTPPQAAETRTTTTSATGGHASASWPTCTAEGMISTLNPHQQQPSSPPHPCSKAQVVGGVKERRYGVNMGYGSALLYYHGTACKKICCPLTTVDDTRDHSDSWPSKAWHRLAFRLTDIIIWALAPVLTNVSRQNSALRGDVVAMMVKSYDSHATDAHLHLNLTVQEHWGQMCLFVHSFDCGQSRFSTLL